jgi:hypothetical protein
MEKIISRIYGQGDKIDGIYSTNGGNEKCLQNVLDKLNRRNDIRLTQRWKDNIKNVKLRNVV